MLEAVEDSDGNQTEFHYRRGTQAIGLESDLFPSPLAQFLELASIRYGGNVRGLPPTYHVDLDYGTRAPKSDGGVFLEPHVFDNSVESALGFAVMRFERLERVVISSQAAGSTPVATYVLRYSVPQAESLFRSLLVGVDSYDALGPDGAAHDSADGGMTPGGDVHRTTFEYFTAPTQDGGTATESSSAFVMGGSGTQETWQLDETDHMPLTGSYTANGFLEGSVNAGFGFKFANNLGGPSGGASASLTAGKTTPVVSMLDVNGDGLADRVVSRLGPVKEEVPGGAWLAARLTSLAPPDTDVVGTVVFLNNGHGFERLAPSRLHNFPRLGRDLQLGMSAGVGFNVGVDLASVAGNLGFQGGAQVTTDTMLDFNGDGLVDGLSARPVVQSQQGGVIRFDDGLSGPGAGCLGLDPSQEPAEVDPDEPTSAPQDTPMDVLRDTAREAGQREPVWRWRAPHAGRVRVTVDAAPLVHCASAGGPPSIEVTSVKIPSGPLAKIPIPALIPFPPEGEQKFPPNDGRWTLNPDAFRALRETGQQRYRAMGVPPADAVEVLGSAPVPFAGLAQTWTLDVERGQEILVRTRAGDSCASDQLEGLTDTLGVDIEVAYVDGQCADGKCITPFSSGNGLYQSARDYRSGNLALPLITNRSAAIGEITGHLSIGAPADEVLVRIWRVTCDLAMPGRFRINNWEAGAPQDEVEDFPFDGFNSRTVVSDRMFDLGIMDDAALPREILRDLPGCTLSKVPFAVNSEPAPGNEYKILPVGNNPAARRELDITATVLALRVGEFIFGEAVALSRIDPADVVAGPFVLTQDDPVAAQPGLLEPQWATFTGEPNARVAVPFTVSARQTEPAGGRYRHVAVEANSVVKVHLVVPPSWLTGPADSRATLVLQQAGRVQRIPLEPQSATPECPAFMEELVCVPPGCGGQHGRPECFTGPPMPVSPVIDLTFDGGFDRGPLFVSLEAPANVLALGLRPDPWNLGAVIAFVRAWLRPEDNAQALAGWMEWQALLVAVSRGVPVLGLDVGGTPYQGAVNLLGPAGTHELPLPLPVASLTNVLTADGFNGWGFGEYTPDPDDEAGPIALEMPDFDAESSDWSVDLDAVGRDFRGAAPGQAGQRIRDALESTATMTKMAPARFRGRVEAAATQVRSAVDNLVSEGTAGPITALRAAAQEMVRIPHRDFHVPRVTAMFATPGGHRGMCRHTHITAQTGQPGRCTPGDVPNLDGLPPMVQTPRMVLEEVRRHMSCTRAVPRVGVNLGLSTGASYSIIGMRLAGTLSDVALDYRDLTGDGIPDVSLATPAGVVVLKSEAPQRGVSRPRLKWTPGAGGLTRTISLNGSLNLARSLPSVQPHGWGGQGKGNGSSATISTANGREGLVVLPSGAAEGNLQLDTGNLADFNGDGLPDMVKAGGIPGCVGSVTVRANVGGRFAQAYCVRVPYTSLLDSFLGIGTGVTVSASLATAASSQRGNEAGAHQTVNMHRHNQHAMFVDVNGDGLPDLVSKLVQGKINIRFNLGDHFSNAHTYPVAEYSLPDDPGALAVHLPGDLPNTGLVTAHTRLGRLRDTAAANMRRWAVSSGLGSISETFPDVLSYTTSLSLGANMGGGAGTPTVLAGVSGHVGLGGTQGISWGNVGFMDIDGDGLPDTVSRVRASAALHVRVNQLGKVNRLRKVVNPLGGTIAVDYQRAGNTFDMPQSRWVMSSVAVDHNVRSMESGEGGDPVNRVHKRSYRYENGKWDRYNRDFYGFARVVTEDEPLTSSAEQVTRKRCVDYAVDSYARAGRVTRERLTQGECDDDVVFLEETETLYYPAHVVSSVNDPLLCPIPQPLPQDSCVSHVVHPAVVVRTSKEHGQVSAAKAEVFGDYDAYGNPLLVIDADDAADLNDNVTMRVIYQNPGEKYLAALPLHFEAYVGGSLVRARDGEFDGNGHLTLHRAWSQSGSLETTYTWDDVGNLRRIVAPTGYEVEITYETATRTFPEEVKDNLGVRTVFADYDHRFGQPRSQKDANYEEGAGPVGMLTRTLDDRGRVLTVASPLTGQVVLWNNYNCPTPGFYRCASTEHLVESNAAHLSTVTHVDGMGQKLYVQKEEVIAGSDYNAAILGAHHVDRWGRQVLMSQVIPGLLALAAVAGPPELVRPTTVLYDAKDRVVETIQPVARITRTSYSATGLDGIPRLLVSVVDPKGTRTDAVLDGQQTLRTDEYWEGGPTATRYFFDALDQLQRVNQDGVDFAWLQHDALGRVTEETTLDTGTKRFNYHPSTGLLLNEVNGADERVSYGYAPNSARVVTINRGDASVRLRYGESPADVATHTVGRVKEALYDLSNTIVPEDWTQARDRCLGEQRCSVEAMEYDALGQQTLRLRTIVENGVTRELGTGQTWDSFGRAQRLLAFERVAGSNTFDGTLMVYGYNAVGRVQTATGLVWRPGGVTPPTWVYDVSYDVYGRTVAMQLGGGLRREYVYDENTEWLREVNACFGSSCINSGALLQHQVLTYDAAGNIDTSVATANVAGVPEEKHWNYGYDQRHRLTHADLVLRAGSAEKLWVEDWAYDGKHRLTQHTVQEAADSAPAAFTRVEAFAFEGLHRPKCTLGFTCAEERLAYDAAGRTRALVVGGQARTLDWTADGMLRRVQGNEGSGLQTLVSNGYALAGERTTRVEDNGARVTRFVGPALARSAAGYNAHVFVNAQRVATEYPGGTAYYIGDQIGSTSMVVDGHGAVATHVTLSPYGEEIVASTGTLWSQTGQRFLVTGKERDESTGYDAFGWRFYSSKAMTWLSAEPMFADALRQGAAGMNLYRYPQNPRVADPNGRYVLDQASEVEVRPATPAELKNGEMAEAHGGFVAGFKKGQAQYQKDGDGKWHYQARFQYRPKILLDPEMKEDSVTMRDTLEHEDEHVKDYNAMLNRYLAIVAESESKAYESKAAAEKAFKEMMDLQDDMENKFHVDTDYRVHVFFEPRRQLQRNVLDRDRRFVNPDSITDDASSMPTPGTPEWRQWQMRQK